MTPGGQVQIGQGQFARLSLDRQTDSDQAMDIPSHTAVVHSLVDEFPRFVWCQSVAAMGKRVTSVAVCQCWRAQWVSVHASIHASIESIYQNMLFAFR